MRNLPPIGRLKSWMEYTEFKKIRDISNNNVFNFTEKNKYGTKYKSDKTFVKKYLLVHQPSQKDKAGFIYIFGIENHVDEDTYVEIEKHERRFKRL